MAASNVVLSKKDEYVRALTDFEKKHKKEGEKEVSFIRSLDDGGFEKEVGYGDGAKFYLKKTHVKETATTTLNGLDFTLEIPMVRFEFWSTDATQHKCFYEKER